MVAIFQYLRGCVDANVDHGNIEKAKNALPNCWMKAF